MPRGARWNPSTSRPRNSVWLAVSPSSPSSVGPAKTWNSEAMPSTRASIPAPAIELASRVAEALAEVGQALVAVRRQLAQRREAGRRRDGVAVERPAVAHRARPPGVEAVHDLGPAAERRERVAAADDLAERREVRRDAEQALGPVRPDPERDDLVEDQHRADAGREVAEEPEERRDPPPGRRPRPGPAR